MLVNRSKIRVRSEKEPWVGPSCEDLGLVGGFTEKVHDTDFMLCIWKFLRGVAAKLPYLLDDGCSLQPWPAEQGAFAGQIDGVPAKERHGRQGETGEKVKGSGRSAHLRWKETEAAGFCKRAAGDGGESRLGLHWPIVLRCIPGDGRGLDASRRRESCGGGNFGRQR
jgi:hypothetical protein